MWVKQSQTTHLGMVYTTYLYLFMVFIHEYYINMFDQRDGGDCPKNVWLSNPAWDMMVKIALRMSDCLSQPENWWWRMP
jgi:hypothetical protein